VLASEIWLVTEMHDEKVKLEIYKLHTELAERVSSLRETMSQIHSALFAGLVAAFVLLNRSSQADDNYSWLFPAFGTLVSLSWILSIHSVTSRLRAKNETLRELEAELSCPFLKTENEKFDASTCGLLRRKNTSLLLPALFFLLCILWLVKL